MASINEVYGTGSTLKASDLTPGIQHEVTIQAVQMKEFDDGKKLELTFLGRDKVMICNKTNANCIADDHGEDYDLWVGKKIYLRQDVCDFQGKPKRCVRVTPLELIPPSQSQTDDIPF